MFRVFRSFYSNPVVESQNMEINPIEGTTFLGDTINSKIKAEESVPVGLTSRVKTRIGSMMGVVSSTFRGAKSKSKNIIKDYSPKNYVKGKDSVFNKEELLSSADKRVEEFDPQLNHIYQTILSIGKEKAKDFYPKLTNLGLLNTILPDEHYFLDMIEVNISKIFTNIINQIHNERLSIANFDKQPMWLNLFVFLFRDNEKKLKNYLFDIESEYESDLKEFSELRKELFPEEDFDQNEVDALIKQSLDAKEWDKRVEIIQKLFPDERIEFLTGWDEVENKKIRDFLDLILLKVEYNNNIQLVFSKFSELTLEKFFPNHFNDFELPKLYQKNFILESIYGFIHSTLTATLTSLYENDKKSIHDSLEMADFALNQIEQLSNINQKRAALKDACGGGELFCQLSKTLSEDCVNMISERIIHKEKNLQEIFEVFGENHPSNEMMTKMDDAIKEWIKLNGAGNLTSDVMIQLYYKTFEIKPRTTIANTESLKLLTKQLKNSFHTFEDIAIKIQANLPDSIKMESFIIFELQEMLKGENLSFKKNREFTALLIEGLLINVFTEIAKNNPGTEDKSAEIIFIENIQKLFSEYYSEATKSEKALEEVSREFTKRLFHDLLGLNQFLPPVFLNLISDSSKVFINNFQNHFSKISSKQPEMVRVKEELKEFGVQNNSEQSTVEVFANDLMGMILPLVLDMMTNIPEEEFEISGVSLVANQIHNLIEIYAKENFKTAELLLNYKDSKAFKKLLKNTLIGLKDQKFNGDKQKIVEYLSNFLLNPFNELINKTVNFGGNHQEESLQKVMGSLFSAGAKHFNVILEAKKIAALDGRDYLLHEDVVKTNQLHAAVPKKTINYQKTINLIKEIIPDLTIDQERQLKIIIKKLVKKEKDNEKNLDLHFFINLIKKVHRDELSEDQIEALKNRNEKNQTLIDVIKEESIAHDLQRKEHAFKQASKVALKLMFPQGLQDITFVPDSQKQAVWNLLEDQLLPLVFPILVELIIDPVMINKILLNVLQKQRDGFNKEIDPKSLNQPKSYSILSEERIEKVELLGKSAGELMASLVNLMELPPLVKNALIDPKTGAISADMQEILGSSLVDVFNEEFISSTLKTSIAGMVSRDKEGKYSLKYDGRSTKEKTAERIKTYEELKIEIKKTTKETIRAYLSNMIRTLWTQLQIKLDKLFHVFGNSGKNVKAILLCRFVFFKLIGSVLRVVFKPVVLLLEKAIYRFVSLEKNLDMITGLFGDQPKDQPEGYSHVVYHENLVYQMAQALNEAVIKENNIVQEMVEENNIIQEIIEEAMNPV